MGQPRGNGQNGGHFYSNITSPVKIQAQFVVNSTDSGGYGITSLKSNGYVKQIYMNTSATPASGSPNPATGNILIQLNNNYNVYLDSSISCQAAVTGGALTSVTTGVAYQIVTIGTTTAAQWAAVGVRAGLSATVGQSFVAIASQGLGGNGTVKAIGTVNVAAMQIVGNPTLSISNSNVAANGGAYVLGQFLDFAGAKVAPTDGTVISLCLTMDNSSVTIDGL